MNKKDYNKTLKDLLNRKKKNKQYEKDVEKFKNKRIENGTEDQFVNRNEEDNTLLESNSVSYLLKEEFE